MDIFYKSTTSAGTLVSVALPPIRGIANIVVFNQPTPAGRTFVNGALITSITNEQQTRTQFQQSLDNLIYVYSFGDQMGSLQVSGLAFPRVCADSSNGISNLLKFYEQNRVSRALSRIRLTFANEVINGFLIGCSLSTEDPASGAHSFRLLLRTLPAAFRTGADNSTFSGGGASPFNAGIA